LAETPLHFGNHDYKPDIIADIIINNNVKRVVFEMKYYGQTENWQKDLRKLQQEYFFMGWHYGYFLAIGSPQQCDEIHRQPIEKSSPIQYETKILTHSIPKPRLVPDFMFAANVLRETVGKDVPYVANEIGMPGAFVFYEDFVLVFDMACRENKLVVRAGGFSSKKEPKAKELGYQYIDFDEEGKMHPSKTFTGDILVGEFDIPRGITVGQVVKSVKEPLNQFMKKMDYL
jgi:hypothetical protein